MPTNKSIEIRLRRLARDYGMELRKSGLKSTHFGNQGLYQIIDTTNENLVILGKRWELNLDDIVKFFNTNPRPR